MRCGRLPSALLAASSRRSLDTCGDRDGFGFVLAPIIPLVHVAGALHLNDTKVRFTGALAHFGRSRPYVSRGFGLRLFLSVLWPLRKMSVAEAFGAKVRVLSRSPNPFLDNFSARALPPLASPSLFHFLRPFAEPCFPLRWLCTSSLCRIFGFSLHL